MFNTPKRFIAFNVWIYSISAIFAWLVLDGDTQKLMFKVLFMVFLIFLPLTADTFIDIRKTERQKVFDDLEKERKDRAAREAKQADKVEIS